MRLGWPSRRIPLLLTAAAVLTPTALAFFPAVPHHKRDLRAEVVATDEQWRAAQTANDTAAMDRLLSDDYLGITAAGQAVTKAQQLDRMRSRETNLTRMQVSDVKIKLLGSSVATVTSSAELEGTMDGRPIHGTFRSTRVYQHVSGGGWKITNFEATITRATPASGPSGPGK